MDKIDKNLMEIKIKWGELVDGHGFIFKTFMFLLLTAIVVVMLGFIFGMKFIVPPFLIMWLLNMGLPYIWAGMPTLTFLPVFCIWVVLIIVKQALFDNSKD